MTNVNTQYTNFTSGELSPKMYGRFDLQAYYNGVRRMENWYAQTQGAAEFRQGFKFIAETANNNKAFLYRFQFSDEQAYILEFTDKNVRIYKDRGVVLSGGSEVDVTTPWLESELFDLKFTQNATDLYVVHKNHRPRKLTRTSDTTWTISVHAPAGFALGDQFNALDITGITQADPAVLTYSGSDIFSNGDRIKIEEVVGMTEVNGNIYVVANVNTGANTFELNDEDGNTIDSTGFTAYSSGGKVFLVDNCPDAATFYENRLIYGGSTNAPETLFFSKSADPDDFTIGTGATDGLQYTISVNSDVNKVEWLRGTEDFLLIGAFGDLLRASGGEGETAIDPNNISIKPTNTFGVADINPVSRNMSVLFVRQNTRALHSYQLEALSGRYKPKDENLLADHITSSGITDIAYQEGRPDIVWCTKNDGKLIGFTFEPEQEVSGWHRHNTTGEFISVATVPTTGDFDDLYVCVKRNIDGTDKYYIEYLTDRTTFPVIEDFVTGEDNESADFAVYQRALFEAQKLYVHVDSALTFDGTTRGVDAGANLTIGAASGTSVTFTASASVFTSGDVGNEIRVKSTDGTRYGIAEITAYTSGTEVTCDILTDFDSTTAYPAGEWYITANTLSGLSHLEGETVTVIADGATHPSVEVSSGSITLDSEYSVAHVGFGYDGYIETMDLEGGGTNGTTQTKKKSVRKVGVRLFQSLGLKLGTSYYSLKARSDRGAIDLMDNPPPLFTGDEIVSIPDSVRRDAVGWSREKRIIIKQDLPLPAIVQLLVPYFKVSNND